MKIEIRGLNQIYPNGNHALKDINIEFGNVYKTPTDNETVALSLTTYKLELLNLKIETLYDFEKKQAVVPVMSINK